MDEYQKLSEKQGHRCAICGQREGSVHWSGVTKQLCVDHCHVTGSVRGLLCGKCNRGIGYFDDDPERVAAALRYLIIS